MKNKILYTVSIVVLLLVLVSGVFFFEKRQYQKEKDTKALNNQSYVYKDCPKFPFSKLTIDKNGVISDQEIKIEKACTDEDRERGLSFRKGLDENSGLIFIFDRSDFYSFWMRDMKFNIDMVWLDESFRVVTVVSDAKADSYPKTFSSEGPAKYVLELNSGDANRLGIKKGIALTPKK